MAFDPSGLSLRLLQSLDYPVKRLVMIAMGSALHLPVLIREAKRIRPDLEVVRIRNNLGCAGGWNEVIHTVPEARWWLIASHDVAFPAGMLARIAERTEAALREEADSGGRFFAPGLRSFAIRGQSADENTLPSFVLTRRVVAAAGLFDENLWPAYAEDLDYLARLRFVGGSRVGAAQVRDSAIEIVHGPEGWVENRHYSGIEQFAWSTFDPREGMSLAESVEADVAVALARREAWEVQEQLRAADNYHLHFCQKFGPLGRPGANCSEDLTQYASVGPFGSTTAKWDDWVLDPGRRLCIYRGDHICPYDTRLL